MPGERLERCGIQLDELLAAEADMRDEKIDVLAVLDAPESRACCACHGKGWNDEWKKVSGHYMGGEAFRLECERCEGAGQVSAGCKGETA